MKYSEVTEVIRWYPTHFSTISDKDIWGEERIDLYVHIPFCAGKCSFCPFNSIPISNQNLNDYFQHLLKEIGMYAGEGYLNKKIVSAVWIGGGTPSAVPFKYIEELLDLLTSSFKFLDSTEITLESNLFDLTEDYLAIVSSSKINRLSVGVQSFNDKYLQMGGRTYNVARVTDFLMKVRRFNLDVSIDLMYRYPGQTLEEVSEEIDILITQLPFIDHITLYPLILFPSLGLFKRVVSGKLPKQASINVYEKMNLLYSKKLSDSGFIQYTSYHFARPGKENKYNIDRWGFPQIECLSFGPGSFGQIRGYVYCNEHKIADYYEKLDSDTKPIQQGRKINLAEQISRYLVLGTKRRVINLSTFKEITGFDINYLYSDVLTILSNEGLIVINEDELFVTDKGCTYIVDVNRAFQTEENLKFTQPQYYILDIMDRESGREMSEVIDNGDL